MKNSWKWLIAAAVILLVSVMSHMSALRNFYVLDDFKLIIGNDFITRWDNTAILADPRHIFKPYPLRCGARPLTVFSLMVDYRFWKLNPFGYHLTNILLHAANGIVLFFAALLILRSLRSGGSPSARGKPSETKIFASALLAALVFTLHPIQAEVVNIASFRADLLATLFSLLALLLFVAASNGSPRAPALYRGTVACFILALFSKEIAISIPLVFLLYLLLLPKTAVSRRHLGTVLAFGAVAALFMTFFWSSRYEYRGFSAIFPGILYNTSPLHSAAAYGNTLLHSFLHYVRTLLVPTNLSVDYQILARQSMLNAANFLSLVLLAFCGALFAFSRNRWLKFGLGFTFLTYLPVSNIIPLINTASDRYMYLPMAGFSILVAAIIAEIPEQKPRSLLSLRIATAFVLLCMYGTATLYRNPVFRDGYALYHDAIMKAPDNVRARYNYAIALMVNARYGEALQEFINVEQLNPLYKRRDLWYLKGECCLNMGNYAEAKEYYRKSLLLKPDKDVLMRYAALLAAEGNQRGAVALLERGTALLPNAPDLYNELGTYYGKERNYSRALNSFKKAVALNPEFEKAWFNMLLLSRQGKKPLPSRDADQLLDYLLKHGWQME